jgi:hypothetical protein
MAGRLPYSDALERWDTEAILAALRDDVVIYVAVHDQPMQGVGVARFLFGVLREELGEIQVTDEIIEDDRAVVLFETSIQGLAAQGLNVIRLDESGRIRELTVFFRPLATLARISDVVGARMEAEFGPPA